MHWKIHPEYVEGCFMCKASSVSVAASAMPTRGGGAQAATINRTDKQWSKDMDSYRRLRKEGHTPKGIDGSARLENSADHKYEIQIGKILPFKGKGVESRINEGMEISASKGYIK